MYQVGIAMELNANWLRPPAAVDIAATRIASSRPAAGPAAQTATSVKQWRR